MNENDLIGRIKVVKPVEPEKPPKTMVYDLPRSHKYCLQERKFGEQYCMEHDVFLNIQKYNEQNGL